VFTHSVESPSIRSNEGRPIQAARKRFAKLKFGGNSLKIAGIILILIGAAALVYGGFSYTSQKKAVDLGPIQIDKTEHHSLPVPPILGVLAIAGGGVLLFSAARKSS
jgi:drug/metabolite transporter (DMT)-like permease